MASITELDGSQKSLDILKIRSTGLAFKIVPQSLNYYADIIFASPIWGARFMGEALQSFEFSPNN